MSTAVVAPGGVPRPPVQVSALARSNLIDEVAEITVCARALLAAAPTSFFLSSSSVVPLANRMATLISKIEEHGASSIRKARQFVSEWLAFLCAAPQPTIIWSSSG